MINDSDYINNSPKGSDLSPKPKLDFTNLFGDFSNTQIAQELESTKLEIERCKKELQIYQMLRAEKSSAGFSRKTFGSREEFDEFVSSDPSLASAFIPEMGSFEYQPKEGPTYTREVPATGFTSAYLERLISLSRTRLAELIFHRDLLILEVKDRFFRSAFGEPEESNNINTIKSFLSNKLKNNFQKNIAEEKKMNFVQFDYQESELDDSYITPDVVEVLIRSFMEDNPGQLYYEAKSIVMGFLESIGVTVREYNGEEPFNWPSELNARYSEAANLDGDVTPDGPFEG